MLKLTTDYGDGTAPEVSQTLDELARGGARRMIAEALKLEADEYVAKSQHLRDEKGHALVVARSCGRGDGALGFWAALRAVHPETREQRCWVHKLANVLDKLPKRLQPRAKAMLHEIMHAPSRKEAEDEIAHFVGEYQARYLKATECRVSEGGCSRAGAPGCGQGGGVVRVCGRRSAPHRRPAAPR